MIVLGIILLLIGYFTGLSILYTIGGILVVIGIVLWILGAVGRPVGGRKVWFSPEGLAIWWASTGRATSVGGLPSPTSMMTPSPACPVRETSRCG